MNDPRVAGAHILESGEDLDDDAARFGLFEGSGLLEVLL